MWVGLGLLVLAIYLCTRYERGVREKNNQP